MSIAARLAELGIVLPTPPAPVASYVPFVRTGNLLFVSGQLPMLDGKLQHPGKLGGEIDLPTGQAAARLCAINILAQAQAALGSLDHVAQLVRLGGFVAGAPDFYDQPKVVNGASDLMQDVFGAAGRHARAAVGVSSLPLNAAVEIDAIFATI
ncbi:MAG: RidA family protein [Alphaproteobacteria bacterium]